MDIMNLIIDFIIISLIPLAIVFLSSIYLKNKRVLDILTNVRYLKLFLLLWIVIGFFSKLDYSNSSGCFVTYGYIFDLERIIYSSFSFFLIICAFLFRRLALLFLVVEFLFWLFKLLFLKSGYAVGITNTPDMLILKYDFIGVFLRLYLVSFFVLKGKLNLYRYIIITSAIISLKTNFLSSQDDFIKEKWITPYLIQKLKNEIRGEWKGVAYYKLLIQKEYTDIDLIMLDKNKKLLPDTTLVDYDFCGNNINKNQEILHKEKEIKIVFTDTSISIIGLNEFSEKEYKLNHLYSSYYPILNYENNVTIRNLIISENKLSAKLDFGFKIELNKKTK